MVCYSSGRIHSALRGQTITRASCDATCATRREEKTMLFWLILGLLVILLARNKKWLIVILAGVTGAILALQAGWWPVWAVFILGITGAILLQGFRQIPAHPPYKGKATRWGKRLEHKVYDEGWQFFLFYPWYEGFVPVPMEEFTFTVESPETRTPDLAESLVPITVTLVPYPPMANEFINSGEREGAEEQLTARIHGRIREWALGDEEGPATWRELVGAHFEAISVLARRIAGENLPPIPEYAQEVPTWIWLRFRSKTQPKKPLANEQDWWDTEGNWDKVRAVLAQIELNEGPGAVTELYEAIEARRGAIQALREGRGTTILPDIGCILKQLEMGKARVTGEVAKAAEQDAIEKQQRRKERTELNHMSKRIDDLMRVKRPDGSTFTRAEAKELVELSTGKSTKTIDSKIFGFDPVAAELIANILKRAMP